MPSTSFNGFTYNIQDVDRLIETHSQLNAGKPGKKGLGHITRSGVVMLCATWEFYLESLCEEAAVYLSKHCDLVDNLPLIVKKEISKVAKESKHELKPLEFAGDGWKDFVANHAKSLCHELNTPKANPIDLLFSKTIGTDNISSNWSCGTTVIDDFVSVRGGIAHTGRQAPYITAATLIGYRDIVYKCAVETDNYVSDYLQTATSKNYKPWNITKP